MKAHTLLTLPLTRLLWSLCAVTLISGWSFALESPEDLPTVLALATGGTIAGVQNDPNDPARYKAGSLSAEEILASVPGLSKHARMEVEQFSNVPSTEITPEDWVRLSNLITARLAQRDDIAGVVVTHGTDRMEETAFFLHLTVNSKKPVIMVGAQRPATHRSADGPANLLSAVRTAVSPDARDRGVMLVMDERILSARAVRKDYPRIGGFGEGQIGVIGHDGPEFLYRPTRPHGVTRVRWTLFAYSMSIGESV
ncbi:MAG: asparaginase [Pseudomonadota bacterium]